MIYWVNIFFSVIIIIILFINFYVLSNKFKLKSATINIDAILKKFYHFTHLWNDLKCDLACYLIDGTQISYIKITFNFKITSFVASHISIVEIANINIRTCINLRQW